ncbi:MAG: hypothetical protein RRA94_02975, partial [Bacteroidota bacterium]|nr:hypothetical protein [Bacteroidota bacterium]
MRRLMLLTGLALLLTLPLRAQNVQVRATIDSTAYLIGEWITLHLQVDAPAEWKIRMPTDDEDFENAEFVSAGEEEGEQSDGRRRITQDVVVTVFDTGRIPVVAVLRYSVPGDTATYTATSDTVLVTMSTVELDTTSTFKDIREVMHVPLTLWDYLMYAGIALLLGLLAWMAYRWLRERNSRSAVDRHEEAELPPDIIALRALEALRNERLWQNARHKDYQSRLTDIIRGYIERRFSVPALEHPTSEIMPEVAMLGLTPVLTGDLERVLRTADMCK